MAGRSLKNWIDYTLLSITTSKNGRQCENVNTHITTPNRLFKYRSFNDKTIGMLVDDQLYFADPRSFNDPLDTKPTVTTDLDSDTLVTTLRNLIEQRMGAEMEAAAKTLRYRGTKTAHISTIVAKNTEQVIENIRYNSTNPEYEFGDPHQYLLGQEIESELLSRYETGVVSFSEAATNPLMWSHYGDQHRGLCAGYSIPDDITPATLYKVKYGGIREIKASKIATMVQGDQTARKQVDEAVLSRKARDWRYEKEWRLIGRRGEQDSPIELEEITFGMRCKSAVKFAVVMALRERHKPVTFFEIYVQRGTFNLKKRRLNVEELCQGLPRYSVKAKDWFY